MSGMGAAVAAAQERHGTDWPTMTDAEQRDAVYSETETADEAPALRIMSDLDPIAFARAMHAVRFARYMLPPAETLITSHGWDRGRDGYTRYGLNQELEAFKVLWVEVRERALALIHSTDGMYGLEQAADELAEQAGLTGVTLQHWQEYAYNEACAEAIDRLHQ